MVEVERSCWCWRLRGGGSRGGQEELVLVELVREVEVNWWCWRLRRTIVNWGIQFPVIELLETRFNFWHGHGISQTINITRLVICRPRQSQGLLYKHLCNSFIQSVIQQWLMKISLRHRHTLMVEDVALSHKIDYVTIFCMRF